MESPFTVGGELQAVTLAPGGRRASWWRPPQEQDSRAGDAYPPPDPAASPRKLWHCASQGHIASSRVQFSDDAAMGEDEGAPLILATISRRTARAAQDEAVRDRGLLLASLVGREDVDDYVEPDCGPEVAEAQQRGSLLKGSTLRPAPPCRLLRAMSQNSPFRRRRSRDFRREETGEPGEERAGLAAIPVPPGALEVADTCGPAAAAGSRRTDTAREAVTLQQSQPLASSSRRQMFRPAEYERPAAAAATYPSMLKLQHVRGDGDDDDGYDDDEDVVPVAAPRGGGAMSRRPSAPIRSGEFVVAPPAHPHRPPHDDDGQCSRYSRHHHRQRALSMNYLVTSWDQPAAATGVTVRSARRLVGQTDGGAPALADQRGSGHAVSPQRRRSSAMLGDEGCSFLGGSESDEDEDDDDEGLPVTLRPPAPASAAAAPTAVRASPSACGDNGHLLISDSSAGGSSSALDGDSDSGVGSGGIPGTHRCSIPPSRGSDSARCHYQKQQRRQQLSGVTSTRGGKTVAVAAVVTALAAARNVSGDGNGGRAEGTAPTTGESGLGRRRSEHGNRQRGRRRQERRRASCWAANDDVDEDEDGDGFSDSNESSATSDGDSDGEAPIAAVVDIWRHSRAPPPAAAGGGGGAGQGSLPSSGSITTLYSLGGKGMGLGLQATAPTSISPALPRRTAATSGNGGTAANDLAACISGSMLFHSLQDFPPWTPPQPVSQLQQPLHQDDARLASSGSGSSPPVGPPGPRMLRPVLFSRCNSEKYVLAPTPSVGAASGGVHGEDAAAPRLAWDARSGSGTGVVVGGSQRTSLEIAADLPLARRAPLSGWSSKSLSFAADGGRRRTGVGFPGLECDTPPTASPSASTTPSQQQKTVMSPRLLKPGAGFADGGASERWGWRGAARRLAAGSDGSTSGGEDDAVGGARETARGAAVIEAGASEQRAATGGMRLPRLHRLLQPPGPTSRGYFPKDGVAAAAAWQVGSRSSGALRVP